MKKVSTNPENRICCDLCGEDYTNRKKKGGMIFNVYAACPECLLTLRDAIKEQGEEELIRANAIKGESFCEFITRIRKYNYNTPN